MKLGNYVQGQWSLGTGAGTVLRDASTGAAIVEAGTAGIDFADVLDYARRVGGPALRALSFHERAGRLKALGKRLSEIKARR